jgi:hypothetical protein
MPTTYREPTVRVRALRSFVAQSGRVAEVGDVLELTATLAHQAVAFGNAVVVEEDRPGAATPPGTVQTRDPQVRTRDPTIRRK